MLCTLSTISNRKLDECRIFDAVPLEMLVIDEASQIYAPDYMVSQWASGGKIMAEFSTTAHSPPFQEDLDQSLLVRRS